MKPTYMLYTRKLFNFGLIPDGLTKNVRLKSFKKHSKFDQILGWIFDFPEIRPFTIFFNKKAGIEAQESLSITE